MGKSDKFNERKVAACKREFKKIDPKEGKKDPLIVISFRNFDINQGQSFEDWEEERLLALATQRLRTLCEHTVGQATNAGIIKIYTKVPFPPASTFKYPRHVPPNMDWSSMHIKGKPCIIGYFEDNIFHVVFLDKEHEFWITEKKNT